VILKQIETQETIDFLVMNEIVFFNLHLTLRLPIFRNDLHYPKVNFHIDKKKIKNKKNQKNNSFFHFEIIIFSMI